MDPMTEVSPYGPQDYGFDPLATPDRTPKPHRGTLGIRLGGMYSGKTTWLNGELTEFAVHNLRVLKITHAADIRSDVASSDESGSTHNPSYSKLTSKIQCLKTHQLSYVDVSKYHVIGVDEAQFFPDLYDAVEYWVEVLGKHVRVVGLDGDSSKKKFGYILDLIPIADDVVKMHARCRMCMTELEKLDFRGNLLAIQAPFTKRMVASTSQIEIGGSDKYIPVCRYHHAV